MVLQITQTVALEIASAVSVYALASAEVGRRREGRRERLDKFLQRVVDLMAAVTEWRGVPGQDSAHRCGQAAPQWRISNRSRRAAIRRLPER